MWVSICNGFLVLPLLWCVWHVAQEVDREVKLFFAFGIAFEIPIAIILMVWAGISTPAAIAEKRRFVVVGVFVIGMLLTPPDVISQTLLAIPMWFLFEFGLICSRLYYKRQDTDEDKTDKEQEQKQGS